MLRVLHALDADARAYVLAGLQGRPVPQEIGEDGILFAAEAIRREREARLGP